VRLYNERLILSLARRFGPLSKIEVARMTGLSVQSTSTIMNRLQADGLLKRQTPLRGRVGQPTVPVSLDPEGAFSIGLKIGRRSFDLVLIDFCGAVRRRAHRTYPYPTPDRAMDFINDELAPLVASLSRVKQRYTMLRSGLTMVDNIFCMPMCLMRIAKRCHSHWSKRLKVSGFSGCRYLIASKRRIEQMPIELIQQNGAMRFTQGQIEHRRWLIRFTVLVC